MNEWTKSQQKAIEFKGADLLVRAGAGSGKTAVLTWRIANLALECDLKDMLVVTFTSAAASEMKARVQKRLGQLAERGGEKGELARARLEGFATANISTLHSFCAALLRRHFQEAELDPAFKVGDAYECVVMRLESARESMALNQQTPGAALLYSLCSGNVEKYLLEVYRFMMSQPKPWQWLERSRANYRAPEASPLAALAYEDAIECLNRAVYQLKEALACLDRGEAALAAITLKVDGWLLTARGALHMCAAGRQDALDAVIASDIGDARTVTPHKKALGERYKPFREWVERAGATLKGLSRLRPSPARMAAMAPAMDALCAVLGDFESIYTGKKRERGIIDFNDMEQCALKALETQSVAREYQQRFQYVFVDEYQDSNAVQEAILRAVSRGNNLFLVGDVKQSIYGFRSADPSIFMSRLDDSLAGRGASITLQENFRSAGPIIGCVNDVFSHNMTSNPDYSQGEALVAARRAPVDAPPVSVHLVQREGEEGEQDAEREARVAARLILQRVGKPLYDGKSGQYRPQVFSDFALLLRAPRSTAEVFARVLAASGIPAYADLTGGFFGALEVQLLINLLKLVDNRRQDIPLVSVLRSGAADFTDEDLAQIRRADQGREAAYHQAFFAASRQEGPLGDKCRAFLAFLDEARFMNRALGLERFVEWITDKTRFGDIMATLVSGEQRRANIQGLLDKAREYEKSSARGLGGFLGRLEAIQEAGEDMGEARLSGEGTDCVRILSIHKSKGLQFPVVLVAGLGKQFNMMDARSPIVMHKGLGVGLSFIDPKLRLKGRTMAHSIIARTIERENRAEELRMLYVAMTRAEEELLLIGSAPEKVPDRWKDAPANSGLDYVMKALLKLEAGGSLARELGLEPSSKKGEGAWRIGVERDLCPVEGPQKREMDLFFESAPLAPCAQLEQRLAWSYPIQSIPSKLAASALTREKPEFDPSPMFMRQVRLSAADIGTAAHSVLKRLDLKESSLGVGRQIEKLTREGLLTQGLASALNVEMLERFAASPLFERMAAAQRVEREWPFTLLVKAREILPGSQSDTLITVQGIIDACFVEQGGWVLLDYKTDRLADRSPQGLERAALVHKGQLDIYSAALERLTGQRVKERYVVLLSAAWAQRV